LSEQESEQKEMLGKDKATKEEKIKGMCDEITLDVVDSIVTEAHEGERLAGLQRQDTEASFCESDALSSEVRLSEGEVLLPKEGSASEGEVTLGGNSSDRPRIREPGVAEYFGDVSASEGEANVVQRSSEGGSQQLSSARGRAVPVGLGQQQQRQHQQQQQRQSSARRVRALPVGLETSTSSSSGLSEGEWRASPRQMQRFLNMAAAFRLNKRE